MSDVLDDIDPETPLGWLRDYIRSNDRAPLTRLRALDRLRMVVASREERPLYFEGYDADLMGPRHSQPTARQWLHRYVMGDVVGPKSFNDLAHAKVEEAVAEAHRHCKAQMTAKLAADLREAVEAKLDEWRKSRPPAADPKWEVLEGMHMAEHNGFGLLVFWREDDEDEALLDPEEDERTERWVACVTIDLGRPAWVMEGLASLEDAKEAAVDLAARCGGPVARG